MASLAMQKTRTPGIYRRGGRYVVVYLDPSGTQRKEFKRTLKAAESFKAARKSDADRGEFRQLSKVRFDEHARDWIETYRGRDAKRGCGDGTRDDYRGALEREAIPFFGRVLLASIEPRDVKRFIVYLETPQPQRSGHARTRGLASGSIKKTIAPLKALLSDAVEEGLIRSNPAASVRIYSDRAAESAIVGDDEEGEVNALTEAELVALLAVLPDDHRPFFVFLAETALRIGEAIEIRWRDVDLGTGWIRVRRQFYRGKVTKPKGGKTRRIRLSAVARQALWQFRKETRAGDDDLIFTAERGGRIIPSNLMSRVLKPAAVEAGLGEWVSVEGKKQPRAETWVGFHSLRHTRATDLFRNGWNAVQVQKFLGHSDPGFTLRTYVHLLPEDLPEPPAVGNAWATSARLAVSDEKMGESARIRVRAGETSDLPNGAELAKAASTHS